MSLAWDWQYIINVKRTQNIVPVIVEQIVINTVNTVNTLKSEKDTEFVPVIVEQSKYSKLGKYSIYSKYHQIVKRTHNIVPVIVDKIVINTANTLKR